MTLRRCMGLLAFGMLPLLACSTIEDPCHDDVCTAVVRADGAPVPPGCDPDADAKEAPACMVDAYAMFVDAVDGRDDNPGTRAAPVQTIRAAIERRSGRPRVYLCGAGPFAESVEITERVSLHGGFACGSWEPVDTKARIAPRAPGYALHVAGIDGAIVVSDVALVAPDATEPGGSSIAGFFADTKSVALIRVRATAGAGREGADGQAPESNLATTNVADLQGLQGRADHATDDTSKTCRCAVFGASTGGAGGGHDFSGDGATGSATPSAAEQSGAGGDGYPGKPACVPGGNGGDGVPAKPAGAGASRSGVLTALGWAPARGEDGAPGAPGSGGGGGGAGSTSNGGGGGCGGCGGNGGNGGGGGGASIALAVFETTLHLVSVTLQASDGGAGGRGHGGEVGQAGGDPGAGGGTEGSGPGCEGGRGGIGAGGGGGAGGAGGISVGVLVTRGVLDGVPTVTLHSPGAGGLGGEGGPAATNAGVSGQRGAAGTTGLNGFAQDTVTID